MGIGTIGFAEGASRGKALIESNFYESGFSNISFPLEAGAYKVTAPDSFTLDATSFSGKREVESFAGNNTISVPDRTFQDVGASSLAPYNGSNYAIRHIGAAHDGATKFHWGISSNLLFTSSDDCRTWQYYTSAASSLRSRFYDSPYSDYMLTGGSSGYWSYYGTTNTSYSYGRSDDVNNNTVTPTLNGFAFGPTSWIGFYDDSYVGWNSSTNVTNGFTQVANLGKGGTDVDAGGYINGNFVVIFADGDYYTASEGDLTSWTVRGNLTTFRKPGGNYGNVFNYAGKLWYGSTSNSATPFYSSTDGITWAPDAGITLPFAAQVYNVEPIAGSPTNWSLLVNPGTGQEWIFTEDFVNFSSKSGTGGVSTSYTISKTTNKDLLMPGSDGNLRELATGTRTWLFEYAGEVVSAN